MNKGLILSLAIVLMNGNAWAGELSEETVNNDCCNDECTCHWSYDTETKTISFTGTGEIKGYGGKWVDEESLKWESYDPWGTLDIKNAYIGEGITSIGTYALYFKNLQEISLSEGLEKIGVDFVNSFQIMNIPSTLKVLKDGSLRGNKMPELILPEGLVEIGNRALVCKNCETLVIPSSVEKLGDHFLTDWDDEPKSSKLKELYCTEKQMNACMSSLEHNDSDFRPTHYEKVGNDYLVYDDKGNVVGKYQNITSLSRGNPTETYKYDSAGHLVGIFDSNGQRTWGKKIYTVEEAMEVTAKGDKFHVFLTYK